MQFSTHIKPIKSFEQTQQTMALLKILALGQNEIARGEFVDADKFIARNDALNVFCAR